MKTRNTLIAVAVAALIPLGVAVAGDPYGKDNDKSMSGSDFKKLDTNKDGRISQAEAAADSTIMFSTADTNGDGYLDKDELKAASKPTNGSRPQSMPSSQSPESSSPNSDHSSSTTDPNQPQGTQPSGARSPDTQTPRQ